MIETLISSKTRIKLLFKFFLNSSTTAYLRGLEEEFGESTNSIRLELNRFENAGFLESYSQANKKVFKANVNHPLFKDINSIVLKIVGLDHVVDYVLQHMGDLKKVYLVGNLSKGKDSPVIDLVLVGDINETFLKELIAKAEKRINKRIYYIHYKEKDFKLQDITEQGHSPLLLWTK
ncbi:MAG: ArsR family transcriptional regulator [Bacteroidetes bacterium]|nr:ArsR family transcriptional regulator [Bacteroidota bacterium]